MHEIGPPGLLEAPWTSRRDQPLVAPEGWTRGRALVRAARPRQWVKNLLVLAAPAAAASVTEPGVLGPVLIAFVAFCLAASGTYLLNDIHDVEADRRHPVKRFRPIAAGEVDVASARRVGAVLLVGAVAVASLAGLALAGLVVFYIGLTAAYTLRLKEIPIIDVAAISVGFVARALAGGVATGTEMTDWFLIVVSFGALFLAAGKRFAELRSSGGATGTRTTLGEYSEPYLRHVTFAALVITVLAYCAWVFEQGAIWLTASVLPLTLALLRYVLLLEHGHGEEPEAVLLTDRPLQILGATWALLFLLGVYLA